MKTNRKYLYYIADLNELFTYEKKPAKRVANCAMRLFVDFTGISAKKEKPKKGL